MKKEYQCKKEECDCPENCECKSGFWRCHEHDRDNRQIGTFADHLEEIKRD